MSEIGPLELHVNWPRDLHRTLLALMAHYAYEHALVYHWGPPVGCCGVFLREEVQACAKAEVHSLGSGFMVTVAWRLSSKTLRAHVSLQCFPFFLLNVF